MLAPFFSYLSGCCSKLIDRELKLEDYQLNIGCFSQETHLCAIVQQYNLHPYAQFMAFAWIA